jgi:hypothetical protein
MIEPNDKVFIRLISDLAEPSSLPSAWDSITDSDTLRTTALMALYRLHSTDAHKFLTVLNNDAPPNESPTALRFAPAKPPKTFFHDYFVNIRNCAKPKPVKPPTTNLLNRSLTSTSF